MKKGIVLLALLALMFGGCDEDVSPQVVQQLATQVEQLTNEADDYQAAFGEVTGILQDVGLIDEETAARIEKVSQKEIDRVQPQVIGITKAAQGVQLGEDDIANWLAIAQAVNQATASYNPYALPITAGLTLAGFIYGLYERSQAKKKTAEAKKNGLKYQAHKQAVEKTMITQPAELQKEMYENIGDARFNLDVK